MLVISEACVVGTCVVVVMVHVSIQMLELLVYVLKFVV